MAKPKQKLYDMEIVHDDSIHGSGKHPTMIDIVATLKKKDMKANISVYDAVSDEYLPVELILRTTDDDVLDKGHLVLVIRHFEKGGE